MLNLNTRRENAGVEILVRGTVQGVGFRPFIYNLACRFGVTGTVSNTCEGVVIKAVAENDSLDAFIRAISEKHPPLACISSVDTSFLSVELVPEDFSILASSITDRATTSIPPDSALCDDCLRELIDPADRRFHYPFINCTNCGPRFTIVESIPYDRPGTSMKTFAMCPACEKEYNDPTDRRFHAQPNGCAVCGPHICLYSAKGTLVEVQDVIASTVDHLGHDKIVAVRGLGGFHLAADGCSVRAVTQLRKRKNRPYKPLAVMVANLDILREFCYFSKQEEQLLVSPQHPIVLLKRKTSSGLAANIAPGITDVGVMLPYTPLHHLLFRQEGCPAALVMSSGNTSGSPICTENKDALEHLETIADFFLLHNRDIVTRVDDSVVKVINGNPTIFRRARGYTPSPLAVPWQLPKILGCGAELKSTFCLGRDRLSFLSQHVGNLTNLESCDFYTESIEHMKGLLQFEPEAVACDLHPDYMSSHYARQLNTPLYRVQHHHAHAVAVMAEHGIDQPVLAVILDGSGYGPDGTIWGGEILEADLTSYSRLGHLSHLHLPGGDLAATEPWRMALSAIYSVSGEEGLHMDQLPRSLKHLDPASVEVIRSMLEKNFNSPLTSSCGRLFDSVAALLGICQHNSYEGQAAMELETLAKRAVTSSWSDEILPSHHKNNPRSLIERNEILELNSQEIVKAVLDGLTRGDTASVIALQFHNLLISSITLLIQRLSRLTGINRVVLSGGCMQNSLLLEGLFNTLSSKTFQVYTGQKLPVNDGAISFGQAIAGGLQHLSHHTHEKSLK